MGKHFDKIAVYTQTFSSSWTHGWVLFFKVLGLELRAFTETFVPSSFFKFYFDSALLSGPVAQAGLRFAILLP